MIQDDLVSIFSDTSRLSVSTENNLLSDITAIEMHFLCIYVRDLQSNVLQCQLWNSAQLPFGLMSFRRYFCFCTHAPFWLYTKVPFQEKLVQKEQ